MANRLVEAAMSTMAMGNPDKKYERQARRDERISNREMRRSDRQIKRNVCRRGLCGGRAKGYIGY